VEIFLCVNAIYSFFGGGSLRNFRKCWMRIRCHDRIMPSFCLQLTEFHSVSKQDDVFCHTTNGDFLYYFLFVYTKQSVHNGAS